MLKLYSRYTANEVEAAVELALEKNLNGSEGVRHLLIYANEQDFTIAPLTNWSSLPPPDLTVYGVLGGVQ